MRPARIRIAVPVALALAACGSGAGGASASSPVVTGDACALHQDATTCRADPSGCAWYPNTRACAVGQPCPAGWCYSQAGGADGGAGVGGAAAACACPGGAGDVCMEQIGGPAVPAQPAITCVAIPAGCTASDPCSCLASGSLARCWSDASVSGLCVCDDGIR